MSLPYLSSTPFTVGSDRLQNGHWKSLNSTTVTLVAAAPRRRLCAYGTTLREPAGLSSPACGLAPPDGFCWSSMAARISPRPLPCLLMSMASLASLGLRGQLGSFLTQVLIFPIPQPHSQSRSFIACSAVTFCPSERPAKLRPDTEAR